MILTVKFFVLIHCCNNHSSDKLIKSAPLIHFYASVCVNNISFCLSQNQVQNLAIRGQQGATTSSSQTQTLQALSLKQSPVPIQPASLIKNSSQGTQSSAGGKASSSDSSSDVGKKGDSAAVTEVRAINMSRSVTAVSAQPLIASGK